MRQKHVFSTDEVPHLWAHQTQESARNAQGNLYFDGPVIYSYGSHFPIAAHVKKGRKRAILFTTRTYSNTTAKHLGEVRRAIPKDVPVFNVCLKDSWGTLITNPTMTTHDERIADYRKRITEAIETVKRARNGGTWQLSNALRTAKEMRAYAKFYGIPSGKSPLPNPKELARIRTEALRRFKVAEERREVRADKERAARMECERVAMLELPEKIAAWRNGSSVQWWGVRDVPTMLRIKGDEVETSLGARVPLDHAKRVLPFVLKLHENGEEWKTNGHTLHLGHYQLDRIDADGVHAGCHHIPWDEVERFAALVA